jgi:hypothetical protein
MPLIEEIPVTVQSAYFSADYLASRSPGAHVKTIIDDFLAYHQLDTRKRSPEFGEALEEFGSLGFGWERAVVNAIRDLGDAAFIAVGVEPEAAVVRRIYEHAFARAFNEAARERDSAIVKLGEIEIDGIYGTQDGYNKRDRRPEEWKCSWGSAAHGIRDDWEMQMCAYAHMWGFDEYVLRAFYVNGYYEKGQMGRPVARAWTVRWSRNELLEGWSLLTDHRDLMVSEGRL